MPKEGAILPEALRKQLPAEHLITRMGSDVLYDLFIPTMCSSISQVWGE